MINIHTQSADIPEQIDGTYPPTREQLIAAGFRDTPPIPPIADGYTRLSIRLIEGDGVTGQWEVADRLTSEIEAEARQADLLANGVRYILQNQYLAMCDQLTGGTDHNKLGFAELQAIIEGMMASNPNAAVVLSLKLLTLNAALVREGGVQWWDECRWTEGL